MNYTGTDARISPVKQSLGSGSLESLETAQNRRMQGPLGLGLHENRSSQAGFLAEVRNSNYSGQNSKGINSNDYTRTADFASGVSQRSQGQPLGNIWTHATTSSTKVESGIASTVSQRYNLKLEDYNRDERALSMTWSSPSQINQLISRSTDAYQWRNVSIGGGGYVTGIYHHPQQQDLAYIRTDVGGFYRWNAVNQSWIPLTDSFPLAQNRYYGGESLALDPNDPNTVYIAAGKYSKWGDKGSIFKSTDQGAHWQKLSLDLPMGGNEAKRWTGERLVINPLDSNNLLFGSRRDGLWQTLDAGSTWSKVTSFAGNSTPGIGITDIEFDKNIPGLVYASAYGDGVYQSTDTGVTWSKLAGSPIQVNRMTIASNDALYVTHNAGVSKFQNQNWQNISPFNSTAVFNGLSINPFNANDILVSLGETPSTKLYRSLDGGASWVEKARSTNSTVPWWTQFMRSHPSVASVEFDPKVEGRVWLTDWYGVWATDDISASKVSWTNYEQGHEQVVTFALAAPPCGSVLLSGLADVDGFNHNNGLTAYPSQRMGAGQTSFQDTYSIAYSESDPLQMVRVGGRRSTEVYSGAKSTDGGVTWTEFASFPTGILPQRVAVSATDPQLLLVTVSEGQAIRSADGGASWAPVVGLPNGPKGPWNWSQPLVADKVDGNRFYYYSAGKVYRSDDGGASFNLINSSLPSEDWSMIKTVPGVAGEVWASLDADGLYRSTDGGATFTPIAKVSNAHLFAFGLPEAGSTIPALYVYGSIEGQDKGIFRSLDRGQTWTSIGDPENAIGNSPNVMEASRQVFGQVFIGTNGRGIFVGNP
ncbi:hypothetical protein [Leptolyngbya sp. FACHB-261]|uniref:hypothetical protein n=1 Tax=Leptolyngbya sp. FACHB-261 TaxID=2692806 RepID=UPI00168787A1|nr:hypothetical protein [Leptolyngbya sp. FACHB-261]MBD2103967.1 hypothetical protein [Leptolyngbya sp. FACHB-261]